MTGRVVGVDLSLTSTGLADSWGHVLRVQTKPRDGGYDDDWRRITTILAAVTDFAAGAELVVLEGPSLGSKGGHAHTRSGLWWHVWAALQPAAVVAPRTRAVYTTGKGTAGKDECLAAAVKRWPAWDITGNDVADAVALMAMGSRAVGCPVESTIPKTHERALAAVSWPAGVAR